MRLVLNLAVSFSFSFHIYKTLAANLLIEEFTGSNPVMYIVRLAELVYAHD